MDNSKFVMTTAEVADVLGVTESRVRQLLIKGKLPAVRIGDRYRGYWKIDPEQVEIFKLTRRGPGAPRRK
jgi:excisionase family DNA binding protein